MVVKRKRIGYSYIRFSTKEQRKGDSLRRQLAATVKWCNENDVELDTSVTLQDLGVSAFKGKHRDKNSGDKYGLGLFLRMIEEGRVAKDSFLVIENLDRLSRENIRAALSLFLQILEAGVSIVTVGDRPMVFRHDGKDMTDIIIAVVELSRGHSESQAKSERVGAAWRMKKAAAREDLRPITNSIPKWLTVEGKGESAKFVERENRWDTVRRIFRLCVEGRGPNVIAKSLNKEGVAPFGNGKTKMWTACAVGRVLDNKAVMGVYQPCLGSTHRTPDGPPVPGYYPVVVSETDFYAAQQAIKNRSKYGGKSNGKAVNLFTSLVIDGQDGSKWSVQSCGKYNGVPAKSMTNIDGQVKGIAERKAVPYRVFESVMLSALREIKPADLLPKNKGSDGDKLGELDKRIRAKAARMDEVSRDIADGGEFKAGMALLRTLQDDHAALVHQHEAVKRTLSAPVVDELNQFKTLADVMDASEDKDAMRDKLRAKIANVLRKVEVFYESDGNHVGTRKLFLVLYFHNSNFEKVIGLTYRPFHVRNNRPELVEAEYLPTLPTNNYGIGRLDAKRTRQKS